MAKEYIEREALLCMVQPDDPGDEMAVITIATAKKLIRSLAHCCPAADVVPAVRCQDCVYARPLKDMSYDYLCRYWNGHSCNQNQFCSQGKRKEDEK